MTDLTIRSDAEEFLDPLQQRLAQEIVMVEKHIDEMNPQPDVP